MPFEKFTETGSGRGGNVQSKISLRKSGSVGVNNAALEEFFDEDDEAVVMYFDEEENQVGMKPTDDTDEEGAYTLSRSDSGGSVTPTAFLRKHDLIPDQTTQYAPETYKQNQNTELVTIDLDDPIGYYGSPEDEDGEDDD